MSSTCLLIYDVMKCTVYYNSKLETRRLWMIPQRRSDGIRLLMTSHNSRGAAQPAARCPLKPRTMRGEELSLFRWAANYFGSEISPLPPDEDDDHDQPRGLPRVLELVMS